jgi:membrane-associated phospholipid phosphatase
MENKKAVVVGFSPSSQTRREFLGRVGGAAALAVAAESAFAETETNLSGGSSSAMSKSELIARRQAAFELRVRRARTWLFKPLDLPRHNGDESRYPTKIGNFSKGLPHDELGQVDTSAYSTFARACKSGRVGDFDAIPLGSDGGQPLRNPQAGLAFTVSGADSHQITIPPPPPFASAELAREMVECYWMSLARDVPFSDYDTNPILQQAAAELSVTPQTIFRAPYAGATVGPHVSQFLLQPFAFGAQPIEQRIRTFEGGVDFLTAFPDWLARQNGAPFPPRQYDSTLRFIRNGRDLAAWVDADPPSQAGLNALLILFGMGCPLDSANPYVQRIKNQDAFTTFGPVDLFDMVEKAPAAAHRAGWFQKWRVHRYLRPEEYGGRVHNQLVGSASYPLPDDVLGSSAVQQVFSETGSYLLPQAYPDGCPLHPAYPSGHSVGSGSTATMLKAVFDESFVIPNPVEASADGLSLVPYSGPPLTVGGELNKLAFNIGMARVFAGIHWRSDVIWGNRVGEAVSLGLLADEAGCYNEPFRGYSLRKFDGSLVTAGD